MLQQVGACHGGGGHVLQPPLRPSRGLAARLRVCAVAAPERPPSKNTGSTSTAVLDPPRTLTAPSAGIAQRAADPALDDRDSPDSPAALQQLPPALDAATAESVQAAPAASSAGDVAAAPQASTREALWGLAIMTAGYLHLSVSLYALPSLLPTIAEDLALNDTQGGLITTGYTVLYGLALVPAGLLADSANRPRLLAAGVGLWSLLTMAISQSQSFGQLMAARSGFALAQATQNPVSYSLIPELFPANRTAAMAVYNAAIYLGRGLSYGVVILAGQAAATQLAGGDAAAAEAPWRTLLWWLGPPGLLTAALAWWTVREPRQQQQQQEQAAGAEVAAPQATPAAASAPSAAAATPRPSMAENFGRLRELARSPPFMALTAAAAVNDIASWGLIGWQSSFYARVFELQPAVYAPLVAVGISAGGLVGGIGSAVFGDRLTRRGARGWLTAGTSVAAAPLVAASFLVDDLRLSFATLLVGYALSECWRAPAAVMVREVSPPELGATASALHLCVRGVVGSLGPLGIAFLTEHVGLQLAMLLIPGCHLVAGLGLAATESVISAERERGELPAGPKRA